jgi:hypothetical protein
MREGTDKTLVEILGRLAEVHIVLCLANTYDTHNDDNERNSQHLVEAMQPWRF